MPSMAHCLIATLSILSLGCGSQVAPGPSAGAGSPAPAPTPNPSLPPEPPIEVAGAFTGVVFDTVTNVRIAGAVVAIAGQEATTDASGEFHIEIPGTPTRVTISATGYLPREANLSGRTAALDLIRDASPFSLDFYRQFVRLTPRGLAPLQRQLLPVNVYIRTIDQAGAAIPEAQLESARQALVDGAASLFGTSSLGAVERGTETRENVPGWITVLWPGFDEGNVCGHAEVGGRRIWLNYKHQQGCGCGDVAVTMRPRTVKHEFGHALGFNHTDALSDVMTPSVAGCDADWSPREKYHAAIAYKRPNGNTDIDVDPFPESSALSIASRGSVVVVD